MDLKHYLYPVLFASVIAAVSASCEITDIDYYHCNYTVVCTTNPGGVSNPNCDVDPYVIMIIKESRAEYLTTGFYSATNFDSRVREIKAVDNSWTNIDSSAFRYYTKSITLDISNNKIVSIKNEAFRSLNYLLYLNISNNNLKSLYPKSFLISDSRNSYVQKIDLSSNLLTELSAELNELPNLKQLYLQNNKLRNIADDAFTNLKKLEYLNLRNNRLMFLNLTLTNVKMLKTLDISNNQLIKISGYEINRLVALVDFNASHNSLTEVESNCFNQAYSLQTVDFSFNQIKMYIENVMFINNNHLQYLDFYNNFISGLQEKSFQHCSLNYLNFEDNNITGDLKENTFAGLHNVTKLDFAHQNINGIKNKAFEGMNSLRYLNLSINLIEVIENSSFSNTTINVLDLSFNKVSNLYFLQNCLANLTELYLNNNNISVVPQKAFDNKTEITKLDLSMNKIIRIDEYSLPLKHLEFFNIKGNHLNGIIRKNVFSPARYLRFLDLSDFNITKIEDLAMVDLTVVARLNLSNNQIEDIGPNNFKGVNNMYSLDMSYNKLSDLTFNISLLTSLKALYLNNNNITNISKFFSNKTKLLYLDLSNNNIVNLTKVGSNIFSNLTVLHLANNKIKTFNNPEIDSLKTLVDLGLSSNKISNINLSHFKELMSVDLSNNRLTYINSTLLKHNEYLQSLDISRNNITDLPPGTFQYMKNLKLLNISSNFLTKIRYGSLKGLHKTEVLDLSKNHIAALDVDVFHECNELRTLIIDYNFIKTIDIERLILISLRNLRSLSLGGNPISCKEIVHNIKASNITFYAIRQVEVTSIDKIYHEDNVHGIKCGDSAIISITTTANSNLTEPIVDTSLSVSSTGLALIWCSVLTVLLVATGILTYIKLYKKRVLVVNSNMTMRMSNSIVSEGSDFQNDLLG